jgi:PREDICTED: hypothetical protein
MSIVNERKEILIKVNTSRKRAIPMVCVAVAIIAASSVLAVVSKKNNAVETKTPEPAKAVTTSATVTTIPQTTTAATTTVPTTTTAPAPTADEIDKISGGLRQASTGTAGTTTTAAALPVEQEVIQVQPEEQNDYQPNEAQQEENTAPAEPEPSYFSEDGAEEMTIYYLKYINNIRESYGLKPFRACGQLDKAVLDSLHAEKDTATTTHIELTSDPYSELANVGLPLNSEITFVYGWGFHYDEGQDPLKKCLEALHQDFPNDNFNDNDLAHGMNDYTYLSVVYYPDPLMDKNAKETANEWCPYDGQRYGIRIYAMK